MTKVTYLALPIAKFAVRATVTGLGTGVMACSEASTIFCCALDVILGSVVLGVFGAAFVATIKILFARLWTFEFGIGIILAAGYSDRVLTAGDHTLY
jgi:hypothetical protein